MFERIREKIRISNIPVEVERTVVPISQYQELEKELERLKEELKKLREENEQLKTENANLKTKFKDVEFYDLKNYEPFPCPVCSLGRLLPVFIFYNGEPEKFGYICNHCGHFEKR